MITVNILTLVRCHKWILLLDMLITARKRSLGQGNIFTGVCLSTAEGGAASDPAAGCGGRVRGAKKHEIYVAAFGGHLFYDLFVQGWGGHGPFGTPWIRYWGGLGLCTGGSLSRRGVSV